LNFYKKHRREAEQSYYEFDKNIEDYVPDTSSTPQERIELREEYVRAGKAMELLPERERELLYQKYYLQYSDEAISSTMGIKKDSLRTYLSRARNMLRDFMLKGGEDSE
jgi:RNA polymerase sigma-70 factor (ECF subfamily)